VGLVIDIRRNRIAQRFCAVSVSNRADVGVGVERGAQVFGHRRILLAVGGIPPAIGLRALDLGEAAGAHPPLSDEALDVVAVALRPGAAGATRCERLECVVLVESPDLPVDPAVAQCDVERFVVGDARLGR
jgi:hypothetical protein